MSDSKNSGPGKTFTITRTFNAPRELVFDVWTDVKHLTKWFGPKGFTVRFGSLELKPGGTYLYSMTSPDGKEMWGKWVFREIKRPEKIVLVNSFSDAAGGLKRHPWSPNWPLETLSTTTLVEADGKTVMTLVWQPINATDLERQTFDGAIDGMTGGWTGTFDQLEAYLTTV